MDLKNVKVESPLTSYMFTKATKARIPLSGTFELSPVCNFQCQMCYVRKSIQEVRNHPRPIMTKEQWLQIAKEAREAGMLYLLLTGGEPFLWPDFWSLYDELIDMGFLISINTNGSLIDEKAILHLQQKPPIRINITLYGASDETYEKMCFAKGVFSKVDRAITELKKVKIQVKLNGSLTPRNVSDLEACINYAKERELIYEPTSYMFPPLRRDETMVGKNDRFTAKEAAHYSLLSYKLLYGPEAYEQYLRSIQKGIIPPPGLDESCIDPMDGKIRCRAGKASFWITWDGWMTPCGMMPKPKVDISNCAFNDAWKELVGISESMTLSGVCTTCPNQKICHSCAAMALAETGSTAKIPLYLCEMVREKKKIAEDELTKQINNETEL